MLNFMKPGVLAEVTKIKTGGVTTSLKRGYKHNVLLLSTTKADFEYELPYAVDQLNSMGWCNFADVKDALGEKAAKKVVEWCEKRNAVALKELDK